MAATSALETRLAEALGALKAGALAAAERTVADLVRDFPGEHRCHALAARCATARGAHAEADAAIRRALALAPDSLPAWLEQAQATRARGAWAECAEAMARLCALRPEHAGFQLDLGVALAELGRERDAETAFERALALAPGMIDARFQLARLEARGGRHERALQGFQACCAARPEWPEAWLNLGATELACARPGEAARAYRTALALAPTRSEALDGYARAIYAGGGDAGEVLEPMQRALELTPDSGMAWYRLALALRMVDRIDEFHAALSRALALAPDLLPARWDRFQIPRELVRAGSAADRAFLARWQEGLAHFEQLELDRPETLAQLEAAGALETNFHLHYLEHAFVELQQRYARVVQRLAFRLCPPAEPRARTARSQRIRIGFVSAMFRNHSVTKVFGPMLEALPRERFELSLFHLDARQDATTHALRARADHYFGGSRSLRDWHGVVASCALDALVFVDVGLHGLSQYLASYRFAPLQCALWGHPATTGFPEIDCFVSADAMEPPGAERDYSESLLRLPRLGTCFTMPDMRAPAGAAAPIDLEPGTVRYLVAQTAPKLTPLHDELYARIAAELPAARFFILPHWRAQVREALAVRMRGAFERAGVSFERHVRILPWLQQPEFCALLAGMDLNLDTVGFSGCVSTFEITAADVPTVTLPGALMRARQSSAILGHMGLDELIAEDGDDYVRIAVALGRDPARRAALRHRIAGEKHVLYGDRGVIDAFSDLIARELDRRS